MLTVHFVTIDYCVNKLAPVNVFVKCRLLNWLKSISTFLLLKYVTLIHIWKYIIQIKYACMTFFQPLFANFIG